MTLTNCSIFLYISAPKRGPHSLSKSLRLKTVIRRVIQKPHPRTPCYQGYKVSEEVTITMSLRHPHRQRLRPSDYESDPDFKPMPKSFRESFGSLQRFQVSSDPSTFCQNCGKGPRKVVA